MKAYRLFDLQPWLQGWEISKDAYLFGLINVSCLNKVFQFSSVGQTCGLSNLEMKHVGELAISGL